MHKDAAAKKARDDEYHYEEPMALGWFIALAMACSAGISAVGMAIVWIATS